MPTKKHKVIFIVKKQGPLARYGSRYGVRQKKIAAAIEREQNKSHACPYCERPALKRLAAGIWFCKKCKSKFAGGAYFPSSAIGEQIVKMKAEKEKGFIKAAG